MGLCFGKKITQNGINEKHFASFETFKLISIKKKIKMNNKIRLQFLKTRSLRLR